jgi:hypothetical protein
VEEWYVSMHLTLGSFAVMVPILTGIILWLTLSPPALFARWLDLVDLPAYARWYILSLAGLQFALSYLFEHYLTFKLANVVRYFILRTERVDWDEESGYSSNSSKLKAARWRRKGKYYKAIEYEMSR